MLIKFKATDPRAGTVARMDSSRGQQLIDAGEADQVDENVVERKSPAVIDRVLLEAALAALPGDYTDPDFVVSGMRFYFGSLFTADDEDKVRDLVKPAAPTTSLPVQGSEVASAMDVVASTASAPVQGGNAAPAVDTVAATSDVARVDLLDTATSSPTPDAKARTRRAPVSHT